MAVLMVLVVLMLMVVRVWGILFAHSEDITAKRTYSHSSDCPATRGSLSMNPA